MDVTPLIKQGTQIIQSYAGGTFRVSGQIYDGAILVAADGTQSWGVQAQEPKALREEDFEVLAARASEIDVVLLGTGERLQFIALALKNRLRERGLSVDVMDTGAACRTYNVLMAEGRRVVAALLPF